MKDGAGNEIGRLSFKQHSGDGDPVRAGDGNPLTWNTKLPQRLAITPEAQGNPRDYVQFMINSQSWKTTDNGTPGCNTGEWSSSFSPAVSLIPAYLVLEICTNAVAQDRNMDCFFNC